MLLFFVQSKKSNQKKSALLVKNSSINFVLKAKIHKLTSFRHVNFHALFTALITNYFPMQGIFLFFYIKVRFSETSFSIFSIKSKITFVSEKTCHDLIFLLTILAMNTAGILNEDFFPFKFFL